jgi:hypothetical protein
VTSTLKSSFPGVVALLVVGCATGGARQSAGTALLGSRQAVLESIDDQYVREDGAAARKAQFELAPGRHTVQVSLESNATAMRAPSDRAKTITVCFHAREGRSYLAQPIIEGNRWRAEIVDESTGASVSRACADPQETSPAVEGLTLPSSPMATEPPPSAPLPVPARTLIRDPDLPGSAVTAGVGFCFGGESLYRVSFADGPDKNLRAGRGVLVTVGGLWTPLWIDDRFGLGAGGSIGWKYDNITAMNGSVSLARFPLSATVHSLIRISKLLFTVLSAGVTKEVGGKISGKGFAARTS